MKLKSFINKINKLRKEFPNIDDLELIFSTDDEGNEYNKVIFAPNVCQIENLEYNRSLELVGFYDKTEIDIAKEDVNAICIN